MPWLDPLFIGLSLVVRGGVWNLLPTWQVDVHNYLLELSDELLWDHWRENPTHVLGFQEPESSCCIFGDSR